VKIGELFDVSGKVAVVTGGSRGIGEMITEGLVANGVRVYITARKAEACDATAERLSAHGECISFPADLSTEEGVASFSSALAEREDKLDILVNNAGAAWGAPIDEFPASGFDKVLDINVKAPFLLTQSLLPLLRASASADDPARVIMTGSIDGIRVPMGENYSYSASKAGIHMLARHMAHFLVGEHITVNCIAPGPFESKMMAYALSDEKAREAVASIVPLGRIGRPEDVAGAVLFLASRAGSYLTGAVVPVDGGISTK
jgi:NAD(P)-dependent dehydrogenase (short-subunit alcohol dehydrogenase family)